MHSRGQVTLARTVNGIPMTGSRDEGEGDCLEYSGECEVKD